MVSPGFCNCRDCQFERMDPDAYPCAEPDCGETVSERGKRCAGCEARIDNAIDHREYPDGIHWSLWDTP